MRNTWSLLFFVMCLVVLNNVPAIAQVGPPGDGGDPGAGEPVPISGIEWLLGAAGVWGVRKFYLLRKRDDSK